MEYKTNSLGLVATLLTLGHKLEEVTQEDKIVYFYLENDGSVDDIKRKYELKNLKVDAMTLVDNLQHVKGLVYKQLDGRR
jgi:hypothetical protein